MESTATVQDGLERNFRADKLNVYVYDRGRRWAGSGISYRGGDQACNRRTRQGCRDIRFRAVAK